MRWLLSLLVSTALVLAVAACNRDRPPRTAPYAPDPVSSSGGPNGADGGNETNRPDGGPSTAPTIQPQPGDIQL